jgi:hypothetical protein
MAVTSIAAAIQKYDLALLGGAHEIRERDRAHKGAEIARHIHRPGRGPRPKWLSQNRKPPRPTACMEAAAVRPGTPPPRHPEGEPHHDQHRRAPHQPRGPRQQRQPTTIAARPPALRESETVRSLTQTRRKPARASGLNLPGNAVMTARLANHPAGPHASALPNRDQCCYRGSIGVKRSHTPESA